MRPTTSDITVGAALENSQAGNRSIGHIAFIFLAALTIRWSYTLAIHWFMGDTGLKGPDSYGFERFAIDFAVKIQSGTLIFNDALGANPYTMPLFHWLAGIPFLLFGEANGTLAYVLFQGIFDAFTCVIVYLIALQIYPRVAIIASVFAVFNPTMIVMSGLFYADTPFTFFVALSFLAAFKWMNAPSLLNATLLGSALGLAALVRAIIVPWAFVALALVVGFTFYKRHTSRNIVTIAAALAVLCLCVGVILVKNKRLYDTFGISPQGGIYLALWIVPLAKEMQDRTPYGTTYDQIEKRMNERFGPLPENYFEQSRQYTLIGRDALKDIPLSALLKTWLFGMAVNLGSPAAVLSPPISQIPRIGFFNTPGQSLLEKVYNYAFAPGQILYSIALLAGASGLAILRILQAIGFSSMARHRANWPTLTIIISWIGYLLLVSGPIASPKYRLPLEPLFCLLTASGLIAALDFYWSRRLRSM